MPIVVYTWNSNLDSSWPADAGLTKVCSFSVSNVKSLKGTIGMFFNFGSEIPKLPLNFHIVHNYYISDRNDRPVFLYLIVHDDDHNVASVGMLSLSQQNQPTTIYFNIVLMFSQFLFFLPSMSCGMTLVFMMKL